MRYETTPSFVADYRRLNKREQATFRRVVLEDFNPACDAFRGSPSTPFPDRVRVKPISSAPGIFEMTWSFAGPDGRATFEWIDVDGQPVVRWRRIGGHRIFRDIGG